MLLRLLPVCMLLCQSVLSLSKFKEHYAWKQVDFAWPSYTAREQALRTKMYVPENVLPLGIEASEDRLVVTLPRWKPGLPATLATVPRYSSTRSPLLAPYPNWLWHQPGNCDGLTSVIRVNLDSCNRLWVLDSGAVNSTSNSGSKYSCPPKLFIFDFRTDDLLVRYELPREVIKEGSLMINIVVDVLDCGLNAYAYMADMEKFAIVTYSLKTNTSWRIEHEYFKPDPLTTKLTVNNTSFTWSSGIFGMALSPPKSQYMSEKVLYFHPFSSFREFAVSTLILRNSTAKKEDIANYFQKFSPRGSSNEHSSASAMSANGVLFFNLVSRNAIGCWNSRNPHEPGYIGLVDKDDKALVFPNDIRIDRDENIWVLSDRLPQYLYSHLNSSDFNFRILTAKVSDAVRGGVCDGVTRQLYAHPFFRIPNNELRRKNVGGTLQ